MPPAIMLAVLAITGCDSRPDYVLSENKMASVLADLSIADQISLRSSREQGEFKNDSARKVLRQSIMKKNGVTEAQFDSTLNWYGHHIDDYAELYKKVGQNLTDRQKKINHNAGVINDDVNNLWPLPTMISISERDASDGFSFSVKGNKFSAGNNIIWSMKLMNLTGHATLFMAAEYPGMEMQYTRRFISSDGTHEIQLRLEKGRRPERIFGYLHLSESPGRRLWVDSINLVQRPASATDFNPDAPSNQTIITSVRGSKN